MSTFRVASIYAKSLLQQAVEEGALDNIHTDMLLLEQVCTDNTALLKTLQSPVVSHDKKLAILHRLLKGRVSSLLLSFLNMISQNRRTAIISDIMQSFLRQYNSYKGIRTASVTTTFQLSEDLISRFKALVKSIMPCKEVALTQHVDPTILGGYILHVEDKQLDECLATKLHALKQYCVTSGY
ncbi:MAG: ATP synthase F1 subunit delta [Bacteroidota bacterium]